MAVDSQLKTVRLLFASQVLIWDLVQLLRIIEKNTNVVQKSFALPTLSLPARNTASPCARECHCCSRPPRLLEFGILKCDGNHMTVYDIVVWFSSYES